MRVLGQIRNHCSDSKQLFTVNLHCLPDGYITTKELSCDGMCDYNSIWFGQGSRRVAAERVKAKQLEERRVRPIHLD
jgi:hypothetical protein